MRLDDVRQSNNVEDRRGGGARGPVAVSGFAVVVALAVSVVTGKNPIDVLSSFTREKRSAPRKVNPNDPQAVFTRKVVATTEDAWNESMPRLGRRYVAPKIVLFHDEVRSACGRQEASVGPFYCPGDSTAYLDLDQLDELQRELGAGGDFAKAYIIGHEVGHHVQNLTGARARGPRKETGPDGSSVRTELQADCYAGVYAAYAKRKGYLEAGDVEEAVRAAGRIGDDYLQKRAKGRVTPESFSHGTSEQRVRWFQRGMSRADPAECDTFSAERL
jgi:predicted metalloprotease